MANRRAPLTQAELTRYAKAMRAAQVPEWRIENRPDGTIVIIAGKAGPDDGANDWDAQ